MKDQVKKTKPATSKPPRKRAPVTIDQADGLDTPRDRARTGDEAFPIVGVGASAGGLEAFTTLLHRLNDATGMALVLIQHLDPTHKSLLRDALAKTTKMAVKDAQEGMLVERDHVYVIRPNTSLGIRDGRLTIAPRLGDSKAPYLPIDFFLRALAAEKGSRAIGVVLSGTASDGTDGLRAIKEAGGITFAQEPRSAKFGDMPQSANEAGVVDYCLPIPELARELIRLSQHPYVIAPESTSSIHDADQLKQIFRLVQDATRIDFSEYKSPTFERRLARRMALQRVDTVGAYLNVLREKPPEVLALYEDSLIHVTSFFRDREVFDSLQTNVFPAIVQHKPEGAPIRIWVAGCATGEEVYSLAIALLEFLGGASRRIQIFGSDVNSKAIEAARAGLYTDSALREVSDERRRRFFTKVERGYRINKNVRDLCIFVQHDLARDPPFSKLDMASCRNVLIYFDQALQKRVVPTFHYALSQPGFLLLGRAENISGFKQLFEPIDKTNKIFARTATPSTLRFARRSEVQSPEVRPRGGVREADKASLRQSDLSVRLDRMLLARYAPPGIVVNEKLEILQFRGQTGGFLQPAPGEPQNNAIQMARDGLAMTLRAKVAEAKKGSVPVRAEGVEVDQNGLKKRCDVVVIPLLSPSDSRDALYVILFEEAQPAAGSVRGRKQPAARTPPRTRRPIPQLEEELASTKEYLQTIIAEHARANEDLGTANEELVSGNEELQSMNEELETAKEELQSINEELTTVNDELQGRNHEVTQINGDLVNLLTTFDIPILILDRERRIRRFTPKARRILNVLAADVGRPFEDIKPNIEVPDLDHQIADVIETMAVRESEVQDRDGRWYRLQIRPYKTTDNRIDGAILSLVDIDALKGLIKVAEQANANAERANRTKDQFLATLSHELRTPLSPMLLRAQLLQRGTMDIANVVRAGEAIEAGVKMQVRLIDDLLDISRIVAGKVTMDLHPVDMRSVVTSALESVTQRAQRKSLELEVDLASGEPMGTVYGDETRLLQIVSNLLNNAVKFTPAHGTVKVSLTTDGGILVLRVQDDGVGIDSAFLPNVFNRFTQEDTETTRSYGGLGLGLAIVRHLVELHHGTVTAESAGSGMGATFSVTLPLMKAPRVPATRSKGSSEHTRTDASLLTGLRILVVDDDRATRDAIAEALAHTGADVKTAPSTDEAMKMVEAFRPDLLLCDIAMPGEDGYAFLRRLRAKGDAKEIPAVALTALAREEDRDRALAAGYQKHIPKPVDIGHLVGAVIELAASHTTGTLGPH